MIVDVGVRVSILRFQLVINSVAIIVAIFCVVNSVVIVILWVRIEVVSYAVIVVIVV